MERIDLLVKGVPVPLLTMFKGFCSINGKNESQGVIDLIIQYIEDNSAGDKAHLKQVISDYRKGS